MKKSVLALLLAVIMAAALLTVGASAADPKGTAGNPFTTVEEYKTAVAGNDWDDKDVYLKIDDKTFDESNLFNLTNVQSRVNPPKLHLTITNCEFTGNTSGDTYGNTSFMYLSNCQELIIRNCKFDAGSGLKYGINWNLIQITGAEVTISNCTFTGTYYENAIKLNQRNGSDDTATDVKGGQNQWDAKDIKPATIKSAVIENCDFSQAQGNGIILLGSAGKNGDNKEASPSTGAFPVTITAPVGKEVNVFLAYKASETEAEAALGGNEEAIAKLVTNVPEGGVVAKTSNTDPVSSSAPIVLDDGTPFMTLSAAISAAVDNDTIHMLQSYDATREGNVTFDSGKNVTLNLGGYTLTVKRFNLTHGWLTVENGKVECAGQAFNVYAAPDASNETDYTKLVIGDTATINAAYGICLFPGSDKAGYSSSIEVYGNIDTGGIFVSGNLGNDDTTATAMAESDKIPTITIHKGAVVNASTESQGIAMNGLANVTVNGGTISGREAIGVKRGTLTVNGGTFTSTGEYTNPTEANHNGTEDTGATISITSTYNYAGTISVTLKGGSFTGENAPAVYVGHSVEEMSGDEVTSSNVYAEGITLNIDGGTFSSPADVPTVYVADKAEDDADGYTQQVVYNGSFSSSVSAYLANGLDYQLQGSDGMFSYYKTHDDAQAAAANDNGAVITGVGDETATERYTITFVYGNSKGTISQTWLAGNRNLPTAPSKPGYIFLGWRCGDATYGAGDSFNLNADMTFYAVWANMPDITPGTPGGDDDDEPVVTFPFNDVSVLDWFYDAVYYVWENDLMNGTDVNQFSPNSPLTRAMVWAVLARVDGETISGDSWMTEAQAWAVESGVSDGTDPTGYVTREQLVTMLYRFAGEPAGAADISGYPDAASISDWAADAMAWAVKVGLIEGDDVGALNPTANSTRAHAATFFMRFSEL